jgi:hypothetical protein
VTVFPINIDDVSGGRIETAAGGLLNLLFNTETQQQTFSWSTDCSALECFIKLTQNRLLIPKATEKFRSEVDYALRSHTYYALGVETPDGEWHSFYQPEGELPNEDLFAKVLGDVPESDQISARCEFPLIAWVWLAYSPLQSGVDARTFGVIADAPLDGEFVERAFDLTASAAAVPLSDRLHAFAKVTPYNPKEIAWIVSEDWGH